MRPANYALRQIRRNQQAVYLTDGRIVVTHDARIWCNISDTRFAVDSTASNRFPHRALQYLQHQLGPRFVSLFFRQSQA
jgi:hypothetical protein